MKGSSIRKWKHRSEFLAEYRETVVFRNASLVEAHKLIPSEIWRQSLDTETRVRFSL